MPSYYDDNFGHWDNMGEDSDDPYNNKKFYFQVQRESVKKICEGCGRTVKLRPEYVICSTCADIADGGGDQMPFHDAKNGL